MKKIIYIALGLFVCALSANNADAAALTQTGGAGSTVNVDAAGVNGAQDINFNPSSNVLMTGVSEANIWKVVSHHTQANTKANGQQYGMHSDSNAMWFQDISGTTGAASISDTTDFASPWFSM